MASLDSRPLLAYLRARQTTVVIAYDTAKARGDEAEADRLLARAQEVEHIRERILGWIAGLPLEDSTPC